MKRKTRRLFSILIIILSFILAAGVAYYGMVQTLAAIQFKKDRAEQIERYENYLINKGAAVNEQSFANFDIDALNPKINEIQTLGTHNSTKKNVIPAIYGVNSFLFGKKNTYSSHYSHDTPVNQLNNGIRGMELDIRYQNGKFEVYHLPGTDKSSNSPDWELTLKELRAWSEHNPDHIPITILVEYKSDNPLWNLKQKKADVSVWEKLDKTVIEIIGREKLYIPADLKAGYPDLKTAVEENAWASLSDAKGKFIFVLHPVTNYTDMYINRDKTLSTQIFFPMINFNEVDKYIDYAAYVLCNTPHTYLIKGLTASNFIVRTRIDDELNIDYARRELTLASTAQLISTDFEPGERFPKTDYVAYLTGNYTIKLRPDLSE